MSMNDVPEHVRRPTLAAISAIDKKKLMSLTYDGVERLVEVHAVGISGQNNPVMRVFQISGGSQSGEKDGWKLMKLSKAANFRLMDFPSEAPREGYAADDSAMKEIFREV